MKQIVSIIFACVVWTLLLLILIGNLMVAIIGTFHIATTPGLNAIFTTAGLFAIVIAIILICCYVAKSETVYGIIYDVLDRDECLDE